MLLVRKYEDPSPIQNIPFPKFKKKRKRLENLDRKQWMEDGKYLEYSELDFDGREQFLTSLYGPKVRISNIPNITKGGMTSSEELAKFYEHIQKEDAMIMKRVNETGHNYDDVYPEEEIDSDSTEGGDPEEYLDEEIADLKDKLKKTDNEEAKMKLRLEISQAERKKERLIAEYKQNWKNLISSEEDVVIS